MKMKISKKVLDKAKQKQKEEEQIEFCLENKVCPKCASDIEKEVATNWIGSTPITLMQCICTNKKCNFTR